jgi:hypothetical protein
MPATLAYLFQKSGGVPVVYGALATTYGHLDVADELVLQQLGATQVRGVRRILTAPYADLPGLARDVAITVDGTAYTIRDHFRVRDGAEVVVLLGDA